jgi:hypothetical protein
LTLISSQKQDGALVIILSQQIAIEGGVGPTRRYQLSVLYNMFDSWLQLNYAQTGFKGKIESFIRYVNQKKKLTKKLRFLFLMNKYMCKFWWDYRFVTSRNIYI